jgi:hypothetical protein
MQYKIFVPFLQVLTFVTPDSYTCHPGLRAGVGICIYHPDLCAFVILNEVKDPVISRKKGIFLKNS